MYEEARDLTTSSRLEDTITFHLIERVQFALNKVGSFQGDGLMPKLSANPSQPERVGLTISHRLSTSPEL